MNDEKLVLTKFLGLENETLLSVAELAEFLGLSIRNVRDRVKDIGYYRLGRRQLFSKEKHIMPYLERFEVKPQTEVKA